MKILIYGLGHIGGSLALGIKKYCKNSYEITYIDKDKKTIRKAKNKKLTNGDLPGTAFEKFSISSADIIFICIDPSKIQSVFKKIKNLKTKKNLIVTDVASTKENVLADAKSILGKEIAFVGGHPIAGTENSGFDYADPNLFKGKIFIQSGSIGLQKNISIILNIWKKLNSNIVKIKPKEHDKVFSYLSHLPHALSFCLNKVAVKRLGAKRVKVFGGTSYMDYSRISSSSENLWSDIFLSNKDNLASSIDDSIDFLKNLKLALKKHSQSKISKLIKSRRP